MNRKFLSVVLSTLITASSCFSPLFSLSAGAANSNTVESQAVTTNEVSEAADPVTLNFYSYIRDYERTDVHLGYKMDQKTTIKANRGDDIKVKIKMKSTDEPYTSSLSLRYDLKESDNIEQLFGPGGDMEVPLGKNKAEFIGKYIPKRESSLLEYNDDITFNPVIQEKIDKYWDDGDIFFDDGAFSMNDVPTWDAFGLVFSQFFSYESAEFMDMRERMHFTTTEGGDEYCTMSFHVSEDTSLGNEQTFVAYFPEFVRYAVSSGPHIYVDEMTMDITGSTYTEPTQPTTKPTAPPTQPPTQPPTESATAIIHFADDNKREPMTVKVGDTFTYDIYLKLTDPQVQSYVTWTYFNQPVGSKKTPNQEGSIQIPEANQVLKVGRNGYTPYYSPFDESFDLMKFPNYLIGFGMGEMDANGAYSMLNTKNGSFTQEGGCLVSTITFTVQKAGEVEVFTRLDDAIVDLDNGEIHADYVAIYNQKVTENPTVPPTQPPTESATAIIHFADDNKRAPMTVKVGDTFTYDIYLKLTDPKVQAFVTWTYFNQPVGTKKTPNQEGSIQIPEENQVLKVGRNGYTPHYSPFKEDYDLMKFSNYLIGFGMGAMDANGNYSMLNTKNGTFTQEGGCLVSTITFTVQKAGEVEVFTRLDDAVVDLDNGEIHADYVAIYNEKVTEEPTQPTAIIHFADDNTREPITLNVGDTFEYDIYVKLTHPKVQAFVTWTYFNQPVGTKKTPNQEGDIQIPEANQVLKVGRNGYTPHYSPFKEDYDLMKFPNYLIGFGMGAMDSNGNYSMLNTKNGTFTQEGGCLVSTITFTVQKAGEVEVFTRLDDAVVDLDNGEIHADYVAVYNEKVTEEPTKPTVPTQPTVPTTPTTPTEGGTAIIHFADDNNRAPMTVKVGDTFTYDIYLKLTDPKVQAFVTWTYFNQPVGTKKTPNQEGVIQIPEENQVLKVGRNGYTPHYSPFKEDYDLMKFSNYLIGFGMGAMDANGNYSMLNTKNGTFTQEGGCLVSTITFTVQKAGEVEVFTRLDDAVVDLDNGEIHADYVAIYNEKVTEEPTQPTAIIHFADDNTREPITLNVGDTFEYDIYVKLTHPQVQAFVTWTYFNQPVGSKTTPNQEGNIQIPEENQVLKVGRNGYTPHYSPFKEEYDLMKFPNYLIGFGMGAMDANGNYSMLNTKNGSFTQKNGCLVSTITFTVQKAGEVEVFTRLDDAVVDLDNGEVHAKYVAVYNDVHTAEKELVLIGDVDGNGEVSLIDLTLIKRYILNKSLIPDNEKTKKSLDVDKNGSIELIDVVYMTRYLLKLNTTGSYTGQTTPL